MLDLVSLQALLDNTAFAVAFLTLIVYWVGAAWPGIPLLTSLGTGGMLINNLVIAVLLGSRWLEAGYFPLSNLYESLFFLAWGMTTLHLVGEGWSQSRWVGVVTAPVILGITAFAALVLPSDMQAAAPLVPALQSNWLMMHVTIMMLSYAALLVGSLVSMAFLVVTRGQAVQLRGDSFGVNSGRRHPQWTASEVSGSQGGGVAVLTQPTVASLSPQRLSLAEVLDNTSYRLIGLGFPLLTIGIIAGAVWANEAWGTYWSWDPKETWALITWLVFAAYLHTRITKGWQGRRPAVLASLGFAVVWVCYLGVNLLGKGLHSYGWFL
jgi:cytochrome c-type biogenesis protein CcsB